MKTLSLVITQYLAIKDYYQVDQLKGHEPKSKNWLCKQRIAEMYCRSVINIWLGSHDVCHMDLM